MRMARGSDSERDEREAGLGLGVGDVVKAGPPSVRAPEPGPAPAEEGDEFTRLENEHRELLRADEVAEQRQQTLRRHRELDRAARFHLGIKFEDPDPELGS
jgi:hypothetical protein